MQDIEVKKRLLITASTFPRYKGDTEPRFILDFAKEMQKYYDVTVLAPACPEAADAERLEGVLVERYHYFPIHKWETLCYPGAIMPRIREKKRRVLLVPCLLLALYCALKKRKRKFDYVHAHWLIPQGIIQSFDSKPYLVTGHGGDVTSLNIWPFKALKCGAVRRAEAVTVVSAALRKEILSWFDLRERGVIAQKVKIQPMGCNMDVFSPRHRVKNLWGQGEEKAILFVGRLAEKKGVRYLIDSMRWIKGILIIVGDGPLRTELECQVKDLGLEERVMFLGARSHEELPEIYASADVFVAPSVTAKDGDKEGFGLVILEAMASGVPVVASRSGGIEEIIQDGINGLLVAERDSRGLALSIEKMLYDDEIREKCIEHMQATVKKYSYQSVGKKYREIFQEGGLM